VIKAIIFDFFGVLALRGSESFRQTYVAQHPEKNQQVMAVYDQLGLGRIGYNEFIDQLAKIAGVKRDDVLAYTEDYQANTQLLDYIRDDLKPNYKIGIISNAGEDWVLKILGEPGLRLFDDIVLSYKVKIIKPQPEIYKTSARNLGVNPEDCIFIDDILTYCQGAEQVGMNTVWYQDFDQFKQELAQIL